MDQIQESELFTKLMFNVIREMHNEYNGLLPMQSEMSAQQMMGLTNESRENMGREHADYYRDDRHTLREKLFCILSLFANKGYTQAMIFHWVLDQVLECTDKEFRDECEHLVTLGYRVNHRVIDNSYTVVVISWK